MKTGCFNIAIVGNVCVPFEKLPDGKNTVVSTGNYRNRYVPKRLNISESVSTLQRENKPALLCPKGGHVAIFCQWPSRLNSCPLRNEIRPGRDGVLEMVAKYNGTMGRWIYMDVNTLIQVTFEKLGFNISFNVLSVCIQAKCTNAIARRAPGKRDFVFMGRFVRTGQWEDFDFGRNWAFDYGLRAAGAQWGSVTMVSNRKTFQG
ncbi:hypothetical protein Zmor_016937 [Zophobas morio]|uniref:Uncharacterized protein n=1 Tax=Zophobas morio TaxID=2755281 RepID=A0AA38I796_9CUCU|nr:hypothetical protein Zmor_016642 [Zophobas morio]KAJ3650859.1 hypothetical protein Zmor_016937 [Zophobas morio]